MEGEYTACANIQMQEWRGCYLPAGASRLRITPEVKTEGATGCPRVARAWTHLLVLLGELNRTGPVQVSAQQLAHGKAAAAMTINRCCY